MIIMESNTKTLIYMKKIVSLALCMTAVGSVCAQKQVVDQAAKLSGKNSQIEEARNLIRQAISNPETSNDARTYFTAGKIEFDAYDNGIKARMINPDDPSANPATMGRELIDGYNYFLKAFPLDSVADAKGKVKTKYSKDMVNRLIGHANDFFEIGAQCYNSKDLNLAYDAFLIYGDLPEKPFFGKDALQITDSLRATSYFNAGLSSYFANDVDKSAYAFRKARKTGAAQKEAFIYEIACWQNIAQRDTARIVDAKNAIKDVALDGYRTFGVAEPLFVNNVVNTMITDNESDQAIALLEKEINNNPENASLLGLRGFVYDRLGKNEESEKDYRKAAQMSGVDFETLKNASKKLARIGTEMQNNIEKLSAEERNALKSNYFEKSLEIAKKAQAMQPDDRDINYVIENIQYALDNYFN